jgi:hypothetical protein
LRNGAPGKSGTAVSPYSTVGTRANVRKAAALLLIVCWMKIAVGYCAAILVLAASACAAVLPSIAPPSRTIDVSFALPQFNREYAAQGGNPQPTAGRLLIYVPAGFNPQGSWPVVIVNSTTDGGRTSTMDAPGYRFVTDVGWVVLATDANIRTRNDTISWRAAVLGAGLDVMHRDWPASKHWPVVFAGISGGAKFSEWMSAIFAQTRSVGIAGIFLAGINDDRMPEALQAFHAPAEFKNVPIWNQQRSQRLDRAT